MRHLIPTVAISLATPALAQHAGDIALTLQGGTIVTNAYAADLAPRPERLFLGTFGDTGIDRFTSNPGFEALPGAFATGTRIGFHATSGLQRWNGAAFEPAGGMELEVKFLTAKFTVADGAVSGFSLAVQSNGGLHRHLSFTLRDPLGTGPASGAWLLSMELDATAGTSAASEPFFVLFNDGLDATVFQGVTTRARDLLLGTPCPGDLDGNGAVDAGDIGSMLVAFGTPDADLDGNGTTDAGDIGSLLILFGPCPP